LGTALHTEDGLAEAEVLYGLASNGARRYYVSLSPEAVERAERVLASYDARALDIIGFNQSLSSSAHRKQRAGDGKRCADCANHRQSPSPDPKCPRW
jgi:hypothetical protein